MNPDEDAVSRIRFRRSTCHVDSISGNVRWEDSAAEEFGELSKESLKLAQRDRGLTKDVFMVSAHTEGLGCEIHSWVSLLAHNQ